MMEAMRQLAQTSRQMLHEIGREPTPEELAEKLAIPLERVRKVLDIAKEPLSLDLPIGEEEDSRLSDLVEDKRSHATQFHDPGQSASGHHSGAGMLDAARRAHLAHALWHRDG